jgi:hypothetical protein
MKIICKSETEPIHISWSTFITAIDDKFVTNGCNLADNILIFTASEEAMAIELMMVRYCWAFAYFSEAEPLVNKIRDKVATTFK